jgi:hypothetical protein
MRRVVAISVIGLVIFGSGMAIASIPDSQGVIHGCYKLNNPAKGSVLVVDTEAGQSCPNGYAALDWSQTGPQGPAGGPGVTDARIEVSSFSDPAGILWSHTHSCQSGSVINGGYSWDPDVPGQYESLEVYGNYITGTGGWVVKGKAAVDGHVDIYVMCANVNVRP